MRMPEGRNEVIALVIAVAMLGSCSSGSRPIPTTRPKPTTTSASTTTTLVLADAANRYLKLANALNATIVAATHQLQRDQGKLPQMKVDYQVLTNGYRTFDSAVRRIGFPAPAERNARLLLRADTTLELVTQAAAYASSLDDLRATEQEVARAEQARIQPAQAVRESLGLPKVNAAPA